MNRLQTLLARALGIYMSRRVQGRDAEVQLKRLKQLQKAYEREYNRTDTTDPDTGQ